MPEKMTWLMLEVMDLILDFLWELQPSSTSKKLFVINNVPSLKGASKLPDLLIVGTLTD